ncbi:uncharacterized protein LOC142357233 [Convolutriloba macropyga]|uniref:uncharacterized protein LOC142357233 n=1 Tax=Convolutriloba macropyga TaxID=536237 RepID=UPI003F51D0E4
MSVTILSFMLIAISAFIATNGGWCPEGFTGTEDTNRLSSVTFRKRCFRPIQKPFQNFYEILNYCQTAIKENYEWRTKVKVFQPKNRDEMKKMRSWLKYSVDNFNENDDLVWLGFVRGRKCDGTGKVATFVSQLSQNCENADMNYDLFSEGEPNNFNGLGEWCTCSIYKDWVADYECYFEPGAYGVCEIDMGW